MKRILPVLCLALLMVLTTQLSAQSKKANIINRSLSEKEEIIELTISDELGTPSIIRFDHQFSNLKANESSVAVLIKDYLQMDERDLVEKTKSFDHQNNSKVDKYQRYYQGILVEHGDYSVLSQNDQIKSIYAEHYLLDDVNVTPTLTEDQALEGALEQLDAQSYAWDATQQFLDVQTTLSESKRAALAAAIIQLYPVGELVLVKDYTTSELQVDLAYKFIIEAVTPLFKDEVYVNAHDGHIMLRDAQIKHGVGKTRYAGTRSFPTTQIDVDTFELRGIEPISGVNCETRSIDGLGAGLPVSVAAIYTLSEPVRDGDEADPCTTDGTLTVAETGDDVWNNDEHVKAPFQDAPLPDISCCGSNSYTPTAGGCNEAHNDDVALDAQWGAAIVLQYWLKEHGRSSFDDNGAAIISFVHYADSYDNAFWNGSAMTYGDGSYQSGNNPDGSFAPLASLDVCAHEIGHAVCTHTADLVYQRESGAMNEGFSDIWAAAIERFALDSVDNSINFDVFGIGEQIDERDGGLPPGMAASRSLRWMDDPKAEGNPDTYGGDNWSEPECGEPSVANDNCGVHNNSGVLNKWYYLLTVGSGQAFSPGASKAANDDSMNDKGQMYNVAALGNTKADLIAFMGETLLLQNAKFADMRAASIDAARILYGACSFEEEQTTNAWHAVGVGDPFSPCVATIEFANSNPTFILEKSQTPGCDAEKTLTFSAFSSMINESIQLNISGTAELGTDFEINTTNLTFAGTETKTFIITIKDDLIIESEETIIISFDNGTFSDSDTLKILDDDISPAIRGLDTLLIESFSVTSLPIGWNRTAINPESANDWFFNGVGALGVAYASLPGANAPTYDQSADANVRLVTPIIDGRSYKNPQISFDWEAGGEIDATDGTLFDFGTFQISTDGGAWADIENYSGSGGGAVTESGTYLMSHPELTGNAFQIGFRWFNDALVGTAFSFTIDNVLITANGLDIEKEEGTMRASNITIDADAYFTSLDDDEVIARIHESAAALGCTQISIRENNPNLDITPATDCGQRSTKVFGVDAVNEASYKLTIYFDTSEVNEWADPSLLNILATKNADIDLLDDGMELIDNDNIVVVNNLATESAYISYTFETDGSFKSFALTDRDESKIVLNTNNIGPGSLRAKIATACPHDTIYFDAGLDQGTILLTGDEIELGSNLTIIGLGINSLTISAESNGRIFNIMNGVAFSLKDIELINGLSTTEGGAVQNNGQLTLENVRIEGSSDSNGPNAIHNNGTILINGLLEIKN